MSEWPRVVVDTSTLIGAVLRPNSVPRNAFLEAVKTHDLCLSNSTLNELREVLHRPKFDSYVPLEQRLNFMKLLVDRARLVDVDAKSQRAAHGVCRDGKDTKFLALALACHAATLISSDGDLLTLQAWRGVSILSPAAFLREAGA